MIAFCVSCTKTPVTIIPGKYDPSGSGTGGNGSGTGANGGANNSDSTANAAFQFSSPDDVAIDAAGNVYVADYGNNRIQKITAAGVVTTFAGSGNIGAINATGTLASFSGPSGVAVDASGNVYVADAGNNLIRKISPGGVVSTLAGTIVATDTSNTVTAEPLFSAPSGVAVDAAGNVFVADAGNNAIRVVSPSGSVRTLAGNPNAGYADGTGGNARFNNPTGVALDASGNVYVADLLNNMIRKITPAGLVTTLAGNGNIGSQNGAAATATFYFPSSLAMDDSGNLLIADGVNNLIRKIAPDGSVSTVAGNGVAGFLNGLGTAASFNDPAGIATDASGNAYVADANNNMVRKISAAGEVTTLAGTLPAGTTASARTHNHYHNGVLRGNNKPVLRNKLQ